MRVQIVIAVAILLVLIYTINAVRKDKIDFKHALKWMICLALMLILDIFPGILTWVADLVGIETPINVMFVLCIGICLIFIFSLNATVSEQADKIKILTQKVALLDKELEEKSK